MLATQALFSHSRSPGRDIGSNHIQVVRCRFQRLLGIMVRNKSGVIVQCQIALAAKAIKDSQQTGMFLVDVRPHKLDDSDVVPRLASGAESMAEHEREGCFEHCFIRQLKASLFIKSENPVGRSELLVGTGEKAFNLCPVNGVRL